VLRLQRLLRSNVERWESAGYSLLPDLRPDSFPDISLEKKLAKLPHPSSPNAGIPPSLSPPPAVPTLSAMAKGTREKD